MTIKTSLLLAVAVWTFVNAAGQYDEKYRPQFHFSPAKGWIGDPDGLIKFKGIYHLFWWGHAVSNDLVHWQELPYPMHGGDGSFHYFSGSVVVDKKNTAGFGDSALVAVYTMHKTDEVPEAQALSYSTNDTIFHFYEKNPVLDIGSTSFRDPQVFWYKPTARWIMAAALPHQHKVTFYDSKDLKHWNHLSDFGPLGAASNDWEVPDLFQLPVDGKANDTKWVLTIGQGPNRMQYFLGDFNGRNFIADAQTKVLNDKRSEPLWIDHGSDFYAARTWRNEDDSADRRTIMLAWMGNWSYAGKVPSSWGKGFESVPREIALKRFDEGIRLVQKPIEALKELRTDSFVLKPIGTNNSTPLAGFNPQKNTYEITATIDLSKAAEGGLHLLCGEDRKLVIGYNKRTGKLYIDRRKCTDFSGDSTFNKTFPLEMTAPLILKNNQLRLHILVDQSSVEVFANDGRISMSALTFPATNQTGIRLFAKEGNVKLVGGKAWTLKSIWKTGHE